jgi:hypothetical protein
MEPRTGELLSFLTVFKVIGIFLSLCCIAEVRSSVWEMDYHNSVPGSSTPRATPKVLVRWPRIANDTYSTLPQDARSLAELGLW